MKIIKIQQNYVEAQIEGGVLRITGEAMMPKQLLLTKYILYKNTLSWINIDAHPDMALVLKINRHIRFSNLLMSIFIGF